MRLEFFQDRGEEARLSFHFSCAQSFLIWLRCVLCCALIRKLVARAIIMLINILWALIIFFCYTCYNLYFILEKVDTGQRPPKIQLLNDINNGGLFKRDCVKETHFCNNNADCIDMCTSRFVCNTTKFICEPPTISHDAVETSVNCNEKHGSYLVLAVNEIVGEIVYCVRTLANLFNENEEMEPHVCSGGTLNVDTTRKDFVPTDCSCPRDKRLVVRRTDPNTPRCISAKTLKILPSFVEI